MSNWNYLIGVNIAKGFVMNVHASRPANQFLAHILFLFIILQFGGCAQMRWMKVEVRDISDKTPISGAEIEARRLRVFGFFAPRIDKGRTGINGEVEIMAEKYDRLQISVLASGHKRQYTHAPHPNVSDNRNWIQLSTYSPSVNPSIEIRLSKKNP